MEWIWFVVAIVAITTGGDIAKKWITLDAKNRQESPEQTRKIRELEERIETLERIATDEKNQLRSKIEAL